MQSPSTSSLPSSAMLSPTKRQRTCGLFSTCENTMLDRDMNGNIVGTRAQVLAILKVQAAWVACLSRRDLAAQIADTDDEGGSLCGVCLECVNDGDMTEWPAGCGHKFCSSCTERCLAAGRRSCPFCRATDESARRSHSREVMVNLLRAFEASAQARQEEHEARTEERNRSRTHSRQRGLRARLQRTGEWLSREVEEMAMVLLE